MVKYDGEGEGRVGQVAVSRGEFFSALDRLHDIAPHDPTLIRVEIRLQDDLLALITPWTYDRFEFDGYWNANCGMNLGELIQLSHKFRRRAELKILIVAESGNLGFDWLPYHYSRILQPKSPKPEPKKAKPS